MKTLIITRHAKSSWDYGVDDKNRPLKERGINDALLVARELKKENLVIDAIFSSPANRALHTCTVFLTEMQTDFSKLTVTEDMYDFGGENVSHLIRSFSNSLNTVQIFGHNFALTSLVNILGDKSISNVPTGGVVIIQFKVDNWKEIGKGKTVKIIFPKKLR